MYILQEVMNSVVKVSARTYLILNFSLQIKWELPSMTNILDYTYFYCNIKCVWEVAYIKDEKLSENMIKISTLVEKKCSFLTLNLDKFPVFIINV